MKDISDKCSAPIQAISRLRMGIDGKGITTLVTFYGCPLRCNYCLNPQTLGTAPASSSLTPSELYNRVKKDAIYFLATGGGVTFGGGEPCLRNNFIREFRELCDPAWKIRIETSLNVLPLHVITLMPVVDQWIVDVKSWDESIYHAYTGSRNELVKQNLRVLAAKGMQDKVLIRLPLIPNYNDEQIRQCSLQEIKDLGFDNFDLFTYKTPQI